MGARHGTLHETTLKRLALELPWAIRILTESATPEALDRKELARRLRGSEPALDFALRAIEERDTLLVACKAFVTAYERSLQLEKTAVALQLCRAAIEQAEATNARAQ